MDIQQRRIEKVQQLMNEQGIDRLVLGPTANMFYLTGLATVPDERVQVVVVPDEGLPTVVLPEMYGEEARKGEGYYRLLLWSDHQDPYELVHQAIGEGALRIAVDPQMWTGHFLEVMGRSKQSEFIDAQCTLMSKVRICKDSYELDLLKKAGQLADKVMGDIMHEIKEGLTEIQLARLIESRIKELGADGVSFSPLVASGENCALPHHRPGSRELRAGDFVLLDFGAVVGGYCSDITRTFCLGQATQQQREIYNIVREANEAGFRAVKQGAACQDVDRAARAVIEDAGYGQYFIHRTGHGIGLDIHEEPYIVEGSTTTLCPGMVFSIEPGIYLPGNMGVRIEDAVALTEKGPVRLNNFPKELFEL